MLKISKKVDYGLMAISHIAHREDDRNISAKQIAEQYDIPVELLAKILQRLAKGGLIVSQNGPKGGYVLAKEPAQITVGQVVKAIEGPIGLVDCYKGDFCGQMMKCSVRLPIRRIQDSISDLLDSMTIEEISQPPLTRLH
jgi:Rrf2 family protein